MGRNLYNELITVKLLVGHRQQVAGNGFPNHAVALYLGLFAFFFGGRAFAGGSCFFAGIGKQHKAGGGNNYQEH